MKIAVSATAEGLDNQVDMRFGRCPYFVVVEVENKKIKSGKSIANPAMMQGGGAGLRAAQLMGDEKVDAVISGNVGPNAFNVLNQLGIEIYQATGKVKDAIQAYLEGKLQKVSDATAPLDFGRR